MSNDAMRPQCLSYTQAIGSKGLSGVLVRYPKWRSHDTQQGRAVDQRRWGVGVSPSGHDVFTQRHDRAQSGPWIFFLWKGDSTLDAFWRSSAINNICADLEKIEAANTAQTNQKKRKKVQQQQQPAERSKMSGVRSVGCPFDEGESNFAVVTSCDLFNGDYAKWI